jgi:hypothetical protein
VVLLAALTGCGSDSAPSESATDLRIIVWPTGRSGDKHEATLSCSPAGGTLANADEACRRLDKLEPPFRRPAGQDFCTQIHGGPAVAEIRGTFEGEQVNATFARTDGCEIALWDRHQFLFPVQPGPP